MTYQVEITAQAETEIDRIFIWLSSRSPQGAQRWYESFWTAVERLRNSPHVCSLAPEDDEFEMEIRQLFFGTRRGAVYRALFAIQADLVQILCVRGPGQRPVRPEDIDH